MILVWDTLKDWYGDVTALEADDADFVRGAGAECGEPFRVGWYICYIPTEVEERWLREYWKAYCENPVKYAGSFVAECVNQWVMDVHYGRSVYLRRSPEDCME